MAIYTDLLMDNGELVRIECPEKYHDSFYETLENAMKRRDWWSPGQFDGCRAEYMGISIGRVNMGRIIGIM